MIRRRLAAAAPLVLLLAGCGTAAGTTAKAAPTVWKTVTIPGPTVTVTKTAKPAAAQGAGTTMSGAGVFVVGMDIRHGVYHTSGAQGGSGGDCYYALLSSTNTNSIIDNNNVTGPSTITVGPGVKAVDTDGCRTWVRIASS